MTSILRVVIADTVFAAIFFIAYRNGYILEAWNNDIAYIIPTICILFIAGHLIIWRQIRYAVYCAETIIVIGFMGTLLGIWTAFGAIDAEQIGNIAQIGSILAKLLTGLGAALWTTITGVFFSIWLNALIEICDGD